MSSELFKYAHAKNLPRTLILIEKYNNSLFIPNQLQTAQGRWEMRNEKDHILKC